MSKPKVKLSHAQFFQVANWLTSQAKAGKLPGGRIKLAVDCSVAVGFLVSVYSISDAATAAKLEFDRVPRAPRSGVRRSRALALSQVIEEMVGQMEAFVGRSLITEDTRKKLRVLSTDHAIDEAVTSV